MKKFLLGTTALIGAVSMSAAALAEGPSVSVGGFINSHAGILDQDIAARDVRFQNDTEVHVKAAGKTDSGLGYGAVIELEADVSTAGDFEGVNADRTFLYLEGGFGRVEFGSNTSASVASKVDASNVAHGGGGVGGRFRQFVSIPTGESFITHPKLPTAHGRADLVGGPDLTSDANKLTYYTPRFSGTQLGISYTPDQGDSGTHVGFSGETNGDQEDVINLGLNYSNTYDNVGVAASIAGEFGSSELAATEDLSAYNIGLNVNFAGFSVGASYGDWNESGQAVGTVDNDASYWTLGAGYEMGPVGVSVTYLDSEYQSNEFTNLVVGADYQLAPGLVPFAEVYFFDFDVTANSAASNDGTLVLLGTSLAF